MFRPVLVDSATVELGRQITAGREQAQAKEQERKITSRRIAEKERAIGGRIAPMHRNPPRKLEGLERIQRFYDAAKAEETQP